MTRTGDKRVRGPGCGALIALEGIDGAGKSTQARALAEWLESQGRRTVLTREPTDGPYGRRLRASAQTGRLSAEEELELFLKDRAQHVARLLEPRRAAGDWVITDRYFYSTIAYQGARGFDRDELLVRNLAIAPPADLLVVMDLPVEVAVERIEEARGGRDGFEGKEYLSRCRETFLWLAERAEGAQVDASRTSEAVAEQIRELVGARLRPG